MNEQASKLRRGEGARMKLRSSVTVQLGARACRSSSSSSSRGARFFRWARCSAYSVHRDLHPAPVVTAAARRSPPSSVACLTLGQPDSSLDPRSASHASALPKSCSSSTERAEILLASHKRVICNFGPPCSLPLSQGMPCLARSQALCSILAPALDLDSSYRSCISMTSAARRSFPRPSQDRTRHAG